MPITTPRTILALSLMLTSGALFSTSALAGVIEQSYGKWQAKIEIQQRSMRSGLELFARADGSPNGNVVMIDRDFQSARLLKIVEQNDMLELDGPNQSHLSLKLIEGDLVGELKQNGINAPVRFHKVDSFGEPLRPQTPHGTLPYHTQELSITSADGTQLSASLTLPNTAKTTTKFNAVVLIHGTGPEDRDQTEDGHKNFAVLADHLTRQGIAVLRYDKRGVMRSAGSFEQHTIDDLLADAQAAVLTLRAWPQVAKVGVIGHSEGGELAARLAARGTTSSEKIAKGGAPAVDFMVSLAGPGLDLMPVLEAENTRNLEFAGATQAELAIATKVGNQFYQIVRTQADIKARMGALGALMQSLSAEEKAVLGKYRAQLPTLSREIAASPWAHTALNTHPDQDWRAVKVPALVLNGEKDTQMNATTNIAAITTALKASGNGKVELAILPALNHNFQTANTGAQSEYSDIAETIAPILLQRVTRFIQQQK
ncbi:MAG: alpha/beta fold hydrolase [Undibacterium sp.]|nr:alpha/beta fold hydrolase [Undibacterium sp.]